MPGAFAELAGFAGVLPNWPPHIASGHRSPCPIQTASCRRATMAVRFRKTDSLAEHCARAQSAPFATRVRSGRRLAQLSLTVVVATSRTTQVSVMHTQSESERKLFTLDEAFPSASNYARRGRSSCDLLAGVLAGVGYAMRAWTGPDRASWNHPKGWADRFLSAVQAEVRTAVAALAGWLAVAWGQEVLAQAVPVPDPDGPTQIRAVPVQVDAPPPAASPAPVASPPQSGPQVPVPAPDTKPPSNPVASVPGQGRFILEMHDGTLLTGVFGETKAVPFEAVFGKIEIPMTSIRTLDFAVVVNGTKTHRVHFINGDMLTGSVGRIAPMKFQTSYGVLTVPLDQVLKVRSGPGLQLAAKDVSSAARPDAAASAAGNSSLPSVPIPDEPPGPIRPRGRIVPDAEVR